MNHKPLTRDEVKEIAEYLNDAQRRAETAAQAMHDGALEASPLSSGTEQEEEYMVNLQRDYARRAEELRLRLWEAFEGGSDD